MTRIIAIISIVGIIVVASWLTMLNSQSVANTLSKEKLLPEEEHFTEIYFSDHLELPSELVANQDYTFTFAIANHEGQDLTYNYELHVEVDGKEEIIDKRKTFIGNNQKKELLEGFVLLNEVKKAKVTVVIPEKNQSIHFWLTNTAEEQ